MPEHDRFKWAFVALGSNLGTSKEILTRALEQLEKISEGPLLRSSFWKTSPVDCPPGSPPFINAVAGVPVAKELTPEKMLERLQAVEWAFGRKERLALNEPRLLDLDLIAFGEEVRSTASLTLPHPRAHQRKFVLAPLAEIAPNLILPGQTRTVGQLLDHLSTGEQLERC